MSWQKLNVLKRQKCDLSGWASVIVYRQVLGGFRSYGSVIFSWQAQHTSRQATHFPPSTIRHTLKHSVKQSAGGGCRATMANVQCQNAVTATKASWQSSKSAFWHSNATQAAYVHVIIWYKGAHSDSDPDPVPPHPICTHANRVERIRRLVSSNYN